ncbi:hypothetical protein K1719_002911 [Acacia pycnantha]|nr:hypothetical protein K1719_002911 [Acacia pycnantha]
MYWVPIIGVPATIGQLGDQEIYCIVDALDTDTTQNEKFMSKSNILGDGVLKIYFVDESSLVLEEIKLDFKDWYSTKYNNFEGKSNNDWWEYVEYDLKKLFRGIVKLFTKLSLDNGMGGVPILYGKLYHMKYDGCEGYRRDIKSLHEIIENVLLRLPPEDGSSETWQVEKNLRPKNVKYEVDKLKKEGESKVRYKRVDSIAFWHNSRYHYNENIVKSERYMWPSVQAAIVHRIDMVGREKPTRKQYMDSKVKQMIKLIEEYADSFAKREEMYYKKRSELMKSVKEFYRAYRALAERYDNATGVIRQAQQTMAEAFPNQVPMLLADDIMYLVLLASSSSSFFFFFKSFVLRL